MSAPQDCQIEISVFGPGYGECILIHIGSNRWIIVDSCIDSNTKSPAALSYLKSLGLDPSECVVLIIATHWHDDHIRGMSRLVQECANAKFCLAAAVTSKEFLTFLASYDEAHGLVAGSGASEIMSTLQTARQQRRKVARVVADTRLYVCSGQELAHGQVCEVWGLSPSPLQFDNSLREIGNLMPQVREAKHRAPEQNRNDLSIATWISVGNLAILLGADLEERADPDLGWSAVVSSTTRPQGQAIFFKIPHHGSQNGHNEAVWRQLLVDKPVSALTPWNKGRGLPRQADLDRIRSYSNSAYSTSTFQALPNKKRIPAVERQLRESGANIKVDLLRTGHVRSRNGCGNTFLTWCVETFSGACHIDGLQSN